MFQTTLLEDSIFWEELWATTSSEAAAELQTDQGRSNTAVSECDTTCGSHHTGKKPVCAPPDNIKYLFSQTVFFQEGDDSVLQHMDSVEGSKRVQVKRKHHEAFPILPPCRVCGAKATGFHFGAITCDACQIFFRRALDRQNPYECKGNKDCNVVPERRLSCPYCRLQRCHQLKMSRGAIQRGRYTAKRKSYCINEARLASEAPEEMNNGHSQGSQNDNTSLNGPSIFVNNTSGVCVQSGDFGLMDSPLHTGNAHYSSGILLKGSPPDSSLPLVNQMPRKIVNTFQQIMDDRLINDADINITYHPVSSIKSEGLGGTELSSSTEVVSSDFLVMNDIDSNELVLRQAYSKSGGLRPNDNYHCNQTTPIVQDVMTDSSDEMSCFPPNDFTTTSTTANSSARIISAPYVQDPSVSITPVSTTVLSTVFDTGVVDPTWNSSNISNIPDTKNNACDSFPINQPFTTNNISNIQDSVIITSGSITQPDVMPTQSGFNNCPSNLSDRIIDEALSNSSSDSVEQNFSLSEMYDPEIEKLIETVTNAHLATLMVTDENRETLLQSQSAHIKKRKLREEVFGHMDPLSPEQYKELYKRTGLQVDNRKSRITKCFLTQVIYVNKLKQFAQDIPGFSDLILDDQIILLRGSIGAWMLFANVETFDCEQKVFTCSACHANCDREAFRAMGELEFHDQWSIASQFIQKLELTDSEAALLKALCVFSPDGLFGLPRNNVLIQMMQLRIVEALCYTMRRERDLNSNKDVAITLGRFVQALTELKHAALLSKRMIDRFVIGMFPDIEYPEVLIEIYGDETRQKLDKLRAHHTS